MTHPREIPLCEMLDEFAWWVHALKAARVEVAKAAA